jgi:hypothetical protein
MGDADAIRERMSDSHTNQEIQALETAWWRTWWSQDFSWDGLAAKPAGFSGTLQDYWRSEAPYLIDEPHSTRRWTRFHCPFVFADGSLSPKAHWTPTDWSPLHMALKMRLVDGTETRPCRLSGVVLNGLREAEDVERHDGAGDLWLLADHAFFSAGVDLSRNVFGRAEFDAAWFGREAAFDGALIHGGTFAGAVFCGEARFATTRFDSPPPFSRAVFPGHFHDQVAEIVQPRAAIVAATVTPERLVEPQRPSIGQRLGNWLKGLFRGRSPPESQ